MVWVRVSSSFIFLFLFFFLVVFSGWLDSLCYLSNVHEAYNLTIVPSFFASFSGFFFFNCQNNRDLLWFPLSLSLSSSVALHCGIETSLSLSLCVSSSILQNKTKLTYC